MNASRSGRNLLLYPLYVGYREYYNKYDREHGGNELSASIGSFLLEGVPRCSAWRSRAHISISYNFEDS